MTRRRWSGVVVLLAFAASLAAACESPTPVQENFGRSFHEVSVTPLARSCAA